MFKHIILSFLFIFAANAKSMVPVLEHEDYVHWSEQKKTEFHVQMMEMVVALESQYNYQTKKYGYSQKRYQKYVEALKVIQSQLFISSAYAAGGNQGTLGSRKKDPNISWDAMAKTFLDLSKANKVNPAANMYGTCLFAGWVSRAVKNPATGEIVCAHPDFINGYEPNRAITDEAKIYPDPKPGTGCENKKFDPEYIQCNPVIFGYRKKADQSLFCVPVPNNGRAENAAFDCMQKSLGLDGSENDADPKDVRLADIKSRYTQNQSAFKAVHDFSFKVCVCSSVPSGSFYNPAYQNYMRPGSEAKKDTDRYRTCFGLMKMMSESTRECQLTDYNDVLNPFEEFIKSKNNAQISGRDADAYYDEYIRSEITKNPTSLAKANEICKDNRGPGTTTTPEKKEFVCSKAECDKDKDGKVTCQFTANDSKDDKTPLKDVIAKVEVKDGDTEVLVTQAGYKGQEVKCPVTWKTPEELACKAECEFPKAEEGKDPIANCKFKVTRNGDESKPLEVEPFNDPIKKGMASIEVKSKVPGSKPVKCEIPWPKDDGKKPGIHVKLKEECAEKTCTAIAEVENADGYNIVWRLEGADDLDVELGPAEEPVPADSEEVVVEATAEGIKKGEEAVTKAKAELKTAEEEQKKADAAYTAAKAESDKKPDDEALKKKAEELLETERAADKKIGDIRKKISDLESKVANAKTKAGEASKTAEQTQRNANKNGTKPAAQAPAPAPPVVGNKTAVQNRSNKEYKVCANLEADGKDPIDGGCATVSAITATTVKTPEIKIDTPKAPAGVFNFTPGGMQAPQIQQRGPSDTSAVGIK